MGEVPIEWHIYSYFQKETMEERKITNKSGDQYGRQIREQNEAHGGGAGAGGELVFTGYCFKLL